MKATSHISPFAIAIASLCLSIIGLALAPLLPLKLSPSAALPEVSIYFGMNGTSQMIESAATSRLEAMLARMSGIERITSRSGNGYGTIRVRLDKNADIDAARFEISTIVRQAWHDMPKGMTYPQITVRHTTDEGGNRPFVIYSINAQAGGNEITDIAEATFRNAFADISGVSNVNICGAEPMEWQLTYDSHAAQSLGITADNIASAIAEYRYTEHAGNHTLTTNTADTLFATTDIFVPAANGEHVQLSRISSLRRAEARPKQIMRINGLNSVYIEITAHPQANQIELQQKIERRIAELKNTLPQGYEVHKVHDTTERISSELSKIGVRSSLTLLILLAFVWLTSFSWRQAAVVAFSIACNVAIAFAAYYVVGIELHTYSLAGITISLNLIIDNAIIMADHWRRKRNRQAILPITAATLTTIGALSAVYLLPEELRLNLSDFATVIIINLTISVLTSLWTVPAIISLQKQARRRRAPRLWLRWAAKFNRGYLRFVTWSSAHRRWAAAAIVLMFGLPLFMLPKQIDGNSVWATIYNHTLGTDIYQENIRPYTDAAFGGALRIFAQKVYNGSYWTNNEETVLTIAASLPYGNTIEQMDATMQRMETLINQHAEVRQFITYINSPLRAYIDVYFTPEAEKSGFPYQLKQEVISQAVQTGGGYWDVYGLHDNGFSNEVKDRSGAYGIQMYGYNYDRLCAWADSIKRHLLSNGRIHEVEIKAEHTHYKSDYREYHLEPRMEALGQCGITVPELYGALNDVFISDRTCGYVWNGSRLEAIKLRSSQSDSRDIWALMEYPVAIGGKQFKIGDLCRFEKRDAPAEIIKENQEYTLCLQYEYTGSSIIGDRVSRATDSIYSKRIPMGYRLKYRHTGFGVFGYEKQQYGLLAIVIAVIAIISSVLFNSLRLPLVIIGIIPVAFVGLFLTFYMLTLNFDQGGLAAMVLLCGITVNASIYLVNEYLVQRRRLGAARAYVKAFSVKIVPIMLTVISTILGFMPFMIGSGREAFWYPLAAGTSGGLIMSVVGIALLLPAFCVRRK